MKRTRYRGWLCEASARSGRHSERPVGGRGTLYEYTDPGTGCRRYLITTRPLTSFRAHHTVYTWVWGRRVQLKLMQMPMDRPSGSEQRDHQQAFSFQISPGVHKYAFLNSRPIRIHLLVLHGNCSLVLSRRMYDKPNTFMNE
jgi:hypothetical protein